MTQPTPDSIESPKAIKVISYSYIHKSFYVGDTLNGMRNGTGTIIGSDDKERYSGEWANDVPNGFGKMGYPNRTYYVGGFVDGKRHGKGSLFSLEGELLYLGLWENDYRHGYGAERQADGTIFHGDFRYGARNGPGRIISPRDPSTCKAI